MDVVASALAEWQGSRAWVWVDVEGPKPLLKQYNMDHLKVVSTYKGIHNVIQLVI